MFRLPYKNLFVALLLTLSSCWVIANDISTITAQSWAVANEQGEVIVGTHINDVRSIASITKLMTVMIVLDQKQPLNEAIPKKLFGKTFTRQMLIDMAIVKSNNEAAKTLCEYYDGGYNQCITDMNAKSILLQMFDTNFVDPTGIYAQNTSTASDLIKLVMAAKNYPEIVEASNKNYITINTNKKKPTVLYNTNPRVGHGFYYFVSKTGFISKSGGCIVMMVNTLQGLRTVILLGSKNTKTRIPEAHMLTSLS